MPQLYGEEPGASSARSDPHDEPLCTPSYKSHPLHLQCMMASWYDDAGDGSRDTTALQMHLPNGHSHPPHTSPQTWESTRFDALDLSPEPPGSPPKPFADPAAQVGASAQNNHIKSSVFTMAKARPRGESDLGRPVAKLNTRVNGTGANGHTFPSVRENGNLTPIAKRSSFDSLRDCLRPVLIPTSCSFSWCAYELSARFTTQLSGSDSTPGLTEKPSPETVSAPSIIPLFFTHACVLTSITLVLVGAVQLARTQTSGTALDRRKNGLTLVKKQPHPGEVIWDLGSAKMAFNVAFGLFLPFMAVTQLGGLRTALVLLLAAASGINHTWATKTTSALQQTPFVMAVLALCPILDLLGLTSSLPFGHLVRGYLALAATITMQLPPIFPLQSARSHLASGMSTSAVPSTPIDTPKSPKADAWFSRPSVNPKQTISEAQMMIATGGTLAVVIGAASLFNLTALQFSWPQIVLLCFAGSASASLAQIGPVPSGTGVRLSASWLGLGTVLALDVAQHLMFQNLDPVWTLLLNGALPLFGCLALFADGEQIDAQNLQSPTKAVLHHHGGHHHRVAPHSALTAQILHLLTPGSLLYSIMAEKDSRRIAYFACLNLGFMLVQFFYGFVSGSLGLLTDSIHMLFDCAGLAVGLAAAVMSKWPPSFNFPYGYGKIDTLSGFANGIFLILVSVEIVFDAVHRLGEGHELRRLNELLVVSILGFLVNIVGLTAFGHAHHHHGHDHGHSHSHAHDHHCQSHQSPLSANTPAASPSSGAHHHHHHDNENMQGIFLHILADALGSLAVIISTLLTQYTGWHGWDPLASCIISFLIFFSAVPLVKGAGMRLLLALPDELEYSVRDALGELGSLRGVVGYQVPKFWLAENGSKEQKHGLNHGHDHHQDHHQHHEHDIGSDSCHGSHDHEHTPEQSVMGVVHVTAARTADVEDVRERVGQLLKGRGIDAIIQVDREAEGRCWCSAGMKVG